jgi:hypothetical protein
LKLLFKGLPVSARIEETYPTGGDRCLWIITGGNFPNTSTYGITMDSNHNTSTGTSSLTVVIT